MSIECLNAALHEVKGLTPTAKFTLVVLANYADQNNTCYPSHQHIADIVGIKNGKHIGKIIKQLEQMGYLKIKYRYKEDGGNKSNEYYLNIGGGVSQNTLPLETTRGGVSTTTNTKEDKKDNYINECFEKFWKKYPRKVKKYKARQKYEEAIANYDEEKLYELVHKFSMEIELEKTPETYIPHCTTWLSQKQYLDYENKTIEQIVKCHEKRAGEQDRKPQWAKDKALLDEQTEKRVSSSWSTQNVPKKPHKHDPKASTKLAEIAAKHKIKNAKGKSR